MKQALKRIVVAVLQSQVKRLLQKNEVKVIGVVGSIGKTSTKLAVARALQVHKSVRFQEGNYNDSVTVPLVFFGQKNPDSLMSIFAWLKIIISNQKQILQKYPYDYVVLELGTDGPGQIRQFASYLQLDIAIVTAITPEHMEFFEDLNAVAEEELSVLSFAKKALINGDLCEARYLSAFESAIATYGTNKSADYQLKVDKNESSFTVEHQGLDLFSADYQLLQLPRLYSVTAATALLAEEQADPEVIRQAGQISMALKTPGRLSLLEGIKNSTIIDDTYNASPEAVKFALDILSQVNAPQRIAILGSMNELGKTSEDAHREIGEYCDSKKIDLVVTIGKAASKDLADAAENRGCKVERFMSPYEAGEFVKGQIKDGAVILAKGSQNGVFAEEAIKLLLKNRADEAQLVRQSQYWIDKKIEQFGRTEQ